MDEELTCTSCWKTQPVENFHSSELKNHALKISKYPRLWCKTCRLNGMGRKWLVRLDKEGTPSKAWFGVKKRRRLDWLEKRGWKVYVRTGEGLIYRWGNWKWPVGSTAMMLEEDVVTGGELVAERQGPGWKNNIWEDLSELEERYREG